MGRPPSTGIGLSGPMPGVHRVAMRKDSSYMPDGMERNDRSFSRRSRSILNLLLEILRLTFDVAVPRSHNRAANLFSVSSGAATVYTGFLLSTTVNANSR